MNPRISECATSLTSPPRSSSATIATSAAIAHQYRNEAGRDTVALHSRLQHENARNRSTHRTLGWRAIQAMGRSRAPSPETSARTATQLRLPGSRSRPVRFPVETSVRKSLPGRRGRRRRILRQMQRMKSSASRPLQPAGMRSSCRPPAEAHCPEQHRFQRLEHFPCEHAPRILHAEIIPVVAKDQPCARRRPPREWS